MNNKKIGFSLIELLISLIVISCITAAFTPLITKKFSSGVFGSGGGSVSDITSECDKFSSNCTLCSETTCVNCNLSCPTGEYKDTKTCSCKKCSDKYGADCQVCNETQCINCADNEYADSDGNCKLCSTKFPDCTSCDETKCTACKDGYILDSSNPTTPCTNFECNGDDFIQIGNLCVTKKNMGDGDKLTIPSGVNVVNAGTSCTPSSSNFCCWKGNTSNTDCDNANGGGYSGCNRTVCDWWAADYICKNFNAGGYTWRLATTSEMSNWANNSVNKGVNGLQLCDSRSGYSSAQCRDTNSCPGSNGNWCTPYNVWSGTVDGSSYAYNYSLISGGWSQGGLYRTLAFSVRCVAQMPSCADRFGDGCLTCDGSTCLSCDSGYILKDGKCVVDCASKFGESCAECNMTQCTKCTDDYKLSSNPSGNPACESDFTCSGSDFMQIGSLCVTRRNMGDSTTLTIPSNITIAKANQNSCNSNSQKCCWQGNTSGTYCDNENGGEYSGCNRTVCNWSAANYICNNFNYGNKTWRLPTISEMINWPIYSIGTGKNGLQLCEYYAGFSSTRCGNTSYCKGAMNKYCIPNEVWSYSSTNSNRYKASLSRGIWETFEYATYSAGSVRCVTNL